MADSQPHQRALAAITRLGMQKIFTSSRDTYLFIIILPIVEIRPSAVVYLMKLMTA